MDTSGYALGGVLSQLQDDKWHSVFFILHTMTDTELNYNIYDKELLAVHPSLISYHHHHFTLPSHILLCSLLPRLDMAHSFLSPAMAFSFLPSPSLSVLPLFFPSPSSLPTSVPPCGGILKALIPFFLPLLFAFALLVHALSSVFSSLHSLHLSRQEWCLCLNNMRSHCVSHMAHIFCTY